MNGNNKKIIGYIALILLLVFIAANIFVSYYLLINRETKEPNIKEQTCNIKVEKFNERKIFIIEPKESSKIESYRESLEFSAKTCYRCKC